MRRSGRVGRIYSIPNYDIRGTLLKIHESSGVFAGESTTRQPEPNENYVKFVRAETPGHAEVFVEVKSPPRIYVEFSTRLTTIPPFDLQIDVIVTSPAISVIKIAQPLEIKTVLDTIHAFIRWPMPVIDSQAMSGFPAKLRGVTEKFDVSMATHFSHQIRMGDSISTVILTAFPNIIAVGGRHNFGTYRPKPDFEIDLYSYVLYKHKVKVGKELDITADLDLAYGPTQYNSLDIELMVDAPATRVDMAHNLAFEQEPGVLDLVSGPKSDMVIDLAETSGSLAMTRYLDLITLPDVRVEEPRFYMPKINPGRRMRFINETGRLNNGLFIKLTTKRDIPINDWEAWALGPTFGSHPEDTATPRGLGLDFKSTHFTGLDLKIRDGLYDSPEWSFFIYIYAHPPTQTDQKGYLLSKGNDFHVQWDGDPPGQLYVAGTGYSIMVDEASGSELSKSFYSLSLSSKRYTNDNQVKIYTNGNLRHTSNQELVFPRYQDHVDLSFGHGSPNSSSSARFAWWSGTILAYYEWDRVLSDAEHVKIYQDPYNVYIPK